MKINKEYRYSVIYRGKVVGASDDKAVADKVLRDTGGAAYLVYSKDAIADFVPQTKPPRSRGL